MRIPSEESTFDRMTLKDVMKIDGNAVLHVVLHIDTNYGAVCTEKKNNLETRFGNSRQKSRSHLTMATRTSLRTIKVLTLKASSGIFYKKHSDKNISAPLRDQKSQCNQGNYKYSFFCTYTTMLRQTIQNFQKKLCFQLPPKF